jgi:hypothetical protein
LLTGALVLYKVRRGGTPSKQGSTTSGMVAQDRGWPHKAAGDGWDVLRPPLVMALSWANVGSATVRFSRVLPSPFEGRDV